MHPRPLDAFAATLVFALCVLAGWRVFGETLTGGFALAIVLVIAGLALVNWPRRARS